MFLKKRVWRPRKRHWPEPEDILAERISDEADYRMHIRKLTMKKGTAYVPRQRIRRQQSVYEMYYQL